jgi:hypothetical protein
MTSTENLIELETHSPGFTELRLVGSRMLTTRSGREIQDFKDFEVYWVPVATAQTIIKGKKFITQAMLLTDYFRQAPEKGYWIASADEDDEVFLLCSYNGQIKDQRITKIVRRGEESYANLRETTRHYIQQQDPYSYLFVADPSEEDILWRIVGKMMDDEYLPSIQACAIMTSSTTPEVPIV